MLTFLLIVLAGIFVSNVFAEGRENVLLVPIH